MLFLKHFNYIPDLLYVYKDVLDIWASIVCLLYTNVSRNGTKLVNGYF